MITTFNIEKRILLEKTRKMILQQIIHRLLLRHNLSSQQHKLHDISYQIDINESGNMQLMRNQ